MDYIYVSTTMWFLIAVLFTLSVGINLFTLIRFLMRKFPDFFYEDQNDKIIIQYIILWNFDCIKNVVVVNHHNCFRYSNLYCEGYCNNKEMKRAFFFLASGRGAYPRSNNTLPLFPLGGAYSVRM